MHTAKSLFTKYQLPIFFLLSYLLSWWSAPFSNGGNIPQGPTLAVVIVVAISAGRQGLLHFWRHLTHWRAGWWYVFGPAIIVAYLFAAFVVNILLGASIASPLHLPSAITLIQLLLLGGLWKEPGWSGYALPRLQERYAERNNGTLIATLTVAIMRVLWHLPLYIYGTLPWYDIFVFVIAFQFIISWLYNKTNGSVPAVMLFHYASNVLGGSMLLNVFSGTEKTIYYILFVAGASLVALVIAWKSQFKLGWDNNSGHLTGI